MLSKSQLIREIRKMINLENEAINTYQALAEECPSRRISEQIIHIAEEEKKHVGEFLRILFQIDRGELELIQEGMEEEADASSTK